MSIPTSPISNSNSNMASLTATIFRLDPPAAALAQASPNSSITAALSHCAGIHRRHSGLQFRVRSNGYGGASAGRLWIIRCSNAGAQGMQTPEPEQEFLGSRDPVTASLGSPGRLAGIHGLQFRVRSDGYGSARAERLWRIRCSNAGAEGMQAPEPEQEFLGSRDPVTASVGSSTPMPLPQRIALFYDAFWRFLRPHTIRGTFLGTTALVTRALLENPSLINWLLLPKALRGLLALLCGNGFIVGINQIYDYGIDKVNKPFLPIAAGDLSVPAAWALVTGLAALGVGIVATNFGPLITALYSLGLFLGTIYSVPPLRLKQHPVPAFLIIATVRGFLLNFGVYYATRAALGLSYEWSPSVIFITIFVTVFATVIAITKDLPDIEGDKKFNISTFATKMGVRKISFLGAGLLLANYVGALVAAFYLPQAFRRNIMVAGHAVLGLCLVYQTWLLDTQRYSKDAIAGFYRFVWNLFYSEYALFPFI